MPGPKTKNGNSKKGDDKTHGNGNGKKNKGSKQGNGKTPGQKGAKTPKDEAAAVRHMANRFAYGYTPALARQIEAAGGPRKWFDQQLTPGSISDPFADRLEGWWFSLTATAGVIWQRELDKVEYGWEANSNYARWCLLRRIYSNRQVLEMVTEFWENHLHVSVDGDGTFAHRTHYGRVIRDNALGKYTDLLFAAITHPAMGIYLNNASSTKKGVNENLGRELLELHTLGAGNFTEDDVKNSARILTGYRVDMWRTWNAYYDPAAHDTGPITVAGFAHPNTDPDGQVATQAYLHYLARHPATARRVCTKLAQRFVSDTPSSALITHLVEVYQRYDTAIVPVLRALVASKEFARSEGKKTRTPTDDVVATYRALRVKISPPTDGDSAANQILWQASGLGHRPFQWPRPDGMPDTQTAWTNASRLLGSFNLHYTMAGGWWPEAQTTYRKPKQWVPHWGMRFDDLVDHLSVQLTGCPVSKRVLKACVMVTGVRRSEPITRQHGVVDWQMPLVLATILDTPDHMSR